jgi:hypothetical protein
VWNKAVITLIGIVGILNIGIFWCIVPLADYDGTVTVYEKYRDALHMAMELGRLDAISLLLTVLGVLLAVLALVGFGYIEIRADKTAREVAETVAETVADRVAREVAAIYINKMPANLEVLGEASSVSKPPEAGKVDTSNVTEVGLERGSDGNA